MTLAELLPLREPQPDLFAGMTKREIYAAIAMLGLCARNDSQSRSYTGLAKEAVDQAEAVLAELEKRSIKTPGAEA